jgi:predicted metal-dependent phosphoesterase TrpH
MIKIDLHMHSGEDPEDGLRYPATALIDKAAALEFGAIAITLHGKVLEDQRVFDYARSKGVLLIPAIELNIQKRDVLLYNLRQREADKLRTFDDLRAFRRDRGDDLLVIAPHPYYPVGHSLKGHLERHIDLFDAIEYAQIHLLFMNPSRRAEQIAREFHKPVVANSDAHDLKMFGRHYSLVEAEPTMPSIFRAIREGRLQWRSPHISIWECLRMFVFDPLLVRRPGQTLESFANQASK